MAAPAYVFTIGYVARQLAIDEATIEDIALEMEPEDGCLSIISDDSGESITAFTQFGIDNLQELLADR
jgi:hypothetical protein